MPGLQCKAAKGVAQETMENAMLGVLETIKCLMHSMRNLANKTRGLKVSSSVLNATMIVVCKSSSFKSRSNNSEPKRLGGGHGVATASGRESFGLILVIK